MSSVGVDVLSGGLSGWLTGGVLRGSPRLGVTQRSGLTHSGWGYLILLSYFFDNVKVKLKLFGVSLYHYCFRLVQVNILSLHPSLTPPHTHTHTLTVVVCLYSTVPCQGMVCVEEQVAYVPIFIIVSKKCLLVFHKELLFNTIFMPYHFLLPHGTVL